MPQFVRNVDSGEIAYKDAAGNFTNYPDIRVSCHESNATDRWSSICRLANITVPQGATIDEAYLLCRPTGSYPETMMEVTTKILAEDNSSSTMATGDFSTATGSGVNFVADVDDLTTQEIDVTSILQTHVNRGGWASGNALKVKLEPTNPTDTANYVVFDTSIFGIDITYTAGGGGGGTFRRKVTIY